MTARTTLARAAVVAAALLVVIVAGCAHTVPDVVPPQGTELFRCQVHRGGGKRTRPDNSLETFLWCWEHGVAPEADARLTKDGVAIALHDETLKRTGRGISEELANTKVKDLEWAAICNVDTGSYLGPEYSSTRIPTVDSIFAAMAGHPDRILYLDEKGAPPELVAELARKHGVEKQVYYTSPNFAIMDLWQKVVPGGLGMVWLGTWPKNNSPESVSRADKFLEESLDKMAAAGWKGVSQVQIHIRTDLSLPDPFCPSSDCIRRAIELLHSNGVTAQAFTWTEGANKDVLRKIWKLGFDNFATDDPLVLFELLPELRRPAPTSKNGAQSHIGRCAVSSATLTGIDRAKLFTGLKKLYVARCGSPIIDICSADGLALRGLPRDKQWEAALQGRDSVGILCGGEDGFGTVEEVCNAFSPKHVEGGKLPIDAAAPGEWPARCDGYSWEHGGTRYLLLETFYEWGMNMTGRRLTAFRVEGAKCVKAFDGYLPFQRPGGGWRTDGNELYIESSGKLFRIRFGGEACDATPSGECMRGEEHSVEFGRDNDRPFDLKFSFPRSFRQYSDSEDRLGEKAYCRVRLHRKDAGWSLDERIALTCTMKDNCYRENCGELGCHARETWCSDVVKEGPGHDKHRLVVICSNVVFDTSDDAAKSLEMWRKAESSAEWASVAGDAVVAVQESDGCIYVYMYFMSGLDSHSTCGV